METNAANTDADAAAVNPLERRLDLSVAIADLDRDIAQRLKQLGKKMKMPGFRPGKVPPHIIRQQYGEDARNEALSDSLGHLFQQAVTEQKLRVAGGPRIEPKDSGSDTHLEFAAIFDVFPQITLADLSTVEIERPTLEVGEAEIDSTIEILRKQRVRYEPVARAAASGDRVTVDFAGTKDGKPFAGGEGKDFRFILGDGKMLADFENAVIGNLAGASKSFPLTFPSEYHIQELAGQTVNFDLTVKEVCEAIAPTVDADFARALGVEDGDLAKMRGEIEENLRREVKKRLQGRIAKQVMDVLLQNNRLDLPASLVKRECDRLLDMTRQDMERRGMKVKDMPFQPEWFAEDAKRRVALGLLFAEIVKTHNLQAKPEQVRALAREAAQSYEHPDEVVRWYYAQPERLDELEGAAVEANVVDWVLGQAKVIDKPIVFGELMGHQS